MRDINVYDYIKNHEDVDVRLETDHYMHINVEYIGACISDQEYTINNLFGNQLRIETRVQPQWNVFDWFGRSDRFNMIGAILPFDLHDYVLVEGKGETYVPAVDKNGTVDFTKPKRAYYHVYVHMPLVVKVEESDVGSRSSRKARGEL